MWAKFCGWLLRAMGWTAVGSHIPEKKGIILGVPHTSAWDFVISYLFYTSTGKKASVMIKKEFFVWPLSYLLRALGAIPIDRSNSTNMLKSLIKEMDKKDEFVLAIAPEGSRKAVKRWKTGYHLIAKHVNCPVYLGFFDWGTKRVSAGQKFELTDDAKADTEKIQAIYEQMHLMGKYPQDYITH